MCNFECAWFVNVAVLLLEKNELSTSEKNIIFHDHTL